MSTGSTLTSGDEPAAAATSGLGRKLLVHVAENGHSFEFECEGSTSVEAICLSIQTLTGISLSEQLLLCGHISLDLQNPLSYYKLPQDDREVFLYNKTRLHSDSPLPQPESIEIPVSPLPPPPTLSSNDSLTIDPALKALVSYEQQFRYHFQLANSIYNSTKVKFEVCKRLVREQQVQERALDTARANLELTFRKLHSRYSDFMKCFSRQHRVHSDLLSNFERDLGKLRGLRLHPILQTEGRKCLADLVKENDLRKWAEICFSSHRQFEGKVLQLKSNFFELKKRVEALFGSMSSNGSKDLEALIKENQKSVNEQKIIMQSLSKDVDTAKKLVDECSSSELSASLRPHDAVSAVGRIYEVHEKGLLPKMNGCDRSVSSLLDRCKIKKNDSNLLVHVSMQRVKSVQFSIKDTMNELHAFQEVMGHQDRDFENLKLVSGIGQAYRACLAEIVRRRSAFKLYMGLAGQLAERLATERETEIQRRDRFFKTWSKYLPHDVIKSMGLFDSPSQCDVNVSSFDGDLLEIDLGDVDRLAPQSLIGSVSTVGSEESSLHAEMEGCDSVSIAGTSRLEVENAKLKAELASAIAVICGFNADIGCYELAPSDEDHMESTIKTMKEKTEEALALKDEYANHLQALLNSKKEQCLTYEKRIRELEQRLSDQKYSSFKNPTGFSNLDLSGEGQTIEGVDESMTDLLSGTGNTNPLADSTRNSMDASMNQAGDVDKEEKLVVTDDDNNSGDVRTVDLLNDQAGQDQKLEDPVLLELERTLAEKASQLEDAESKIRAITEEVNSLRRELDHSRNLLDESQMNCAHLENCLHEAREEARTNKCAADRRAQEYDALRSSALKIHTLFERLRSCVTAPGVPGFADSLHSLSLSLASGGKKEEGEGSEAEMFQQCVKVLADKVGFMSRQSAELVDRCSRMEASHSHLIKDLEDKRNLIRNLYSKLQLEKQASKEKISIGRLEIHELAAFVRTPSGHYEAVNRNCSNYFLSDESVALFTEQHPGPPSYIVGQIVHIERRTVSRPVSALVSTRTEPPSDLAPSYGSGSGSNLNPYNLLAGCEYYVVTVALLPDSNTICSPTAAAS